MEILKVQAGEFLAKQKDKVNMWYLIQEGKVAQKFGFSEVVLGKNAIVGILESDTFMCDYVVKEDVTAAVFSCGSYEELRGILGKQEKTRGLFIRSAIEQKHNILCLYADLFGRVNMYHTFLENCYEEYKNVCANNSVEPRKFSKMDQFVPIQMRHKAENWELMNSAGLVKHLAEYVQLMEKEEALSVGTIMETAAQMRRFTQGVREMEDYLSYNKDILLCESENDIFMLYFDLAITLHRNRRDIEQVRNVIEEIIDFIDKIKVYDEKLCARRIGSYQEHDFEEDRSKAEEVSYFRKEMDIMSIDCLRYILEYGGLGGKELENAYNTIKEYGKINDPYSMDEAVYKLRKQVSGVFYDVYHRCFLRAVKDEESINPLMEMFFNFGFMDKDFLEEKTITTLYNLTEHLGKFNSKRIFTMYRWLRAIYKGEKDPSKNELDMNYSAYLADLYKNGQVTKEQLALLTDDREIGRGYECSVQGRLFCVL